MFDGSDYPKLLNEVQFDEWLEKGRSSKIRYSFLLVIWDSLEEKYIASYAESREELAAYEWHPFATTHESLIAVYDLFSESRIILSN